MSIVNKIFPRQCLICSRLGFDICPKCFVKLPHSLPSCCICKRLNNHYYTHKDCSGLNIQCFSGWYLTRELKYKLQRKKDFQIFSVYKLLLESLIKQLNIEEFVRDSYILPIPAKDHNSIRLNSYLAKNLHKYRHGNVLFVGEEIKEIDWIVKQKGLFLKESPQIQILTIFTQTGLPMVPKE